MIHKLKLYNIDTSWCSSYLNKRCQQTHYAGTISDKKEVISGVPQGSVLGPISDKKEVISDVPQGSVLGPILFLSYVNDLPLSLTSSCADIFADDTTIGTPSHSIDTLIVKYKLALLKKRLGVTISNTLWWHTHIDHLIKKCNSYLFLLSRIKFYLEGTESCFTTLTFYLILISVVLSGLTVVLHWKINL